MSYSVNFTWTYPLVGPVPLDSGVLATPVGTTITSVDVDYGDGSPIQHDNPSSHTYTSEGVYALNVDVYITDSVPPWHDNNGITVEPPYTPGIVSRFLRGQMRYWNEYVAAYSAVGTMDGVTRWDFNWVGTAATLSYNDKIADFTDISSVVSEYSTINHNAVWEVYVNTTDALAVGWWIDTGETLDVNAAYCGSTVSDYWSSDGSGSIGGVVQPPGTFPTYTTGDVLGFLNDPGYGLYLWKNGVATGQFLNSNSTSGRVFASRTSPSTKTVAFTYEQGQNWTWPVTFTNATTPAADSYLWQFGDGSTSTDTNPSHIYALPGSYKVILTATYAGVPYYTSKIVVIPDAGLFLPIKQCNDEEFAYIRQRGIRNSMPTKMLDNGGYPDRQLYFWPVPTDSNMAVELWLWEPLQITDLDAELEMPPGYERYYTYALAMELCDTFQTTPTAEMVASLVDAENQIKTINQVTFTGQPSDAAMELSRFNRAYNIIDFYAGANMLPRSDA